MLTNNRIKEISSLKNKKYRQKYGLFVIEGVKSVADLFNEGKIRILEAYCTGQTESSLKNFYRGSYTTVSSEVMKKMSGFTTPPGLLAVCEIPVYGPADPDRPGLYLALDDIRDPGNLGTIIRLADWFGVKDIFCSFSTVDLYNPKTVQATMGSLSRVRVHYTDLKELLSKTRAPIYGAFLKGENIYRAHIPPHALLVIGNESNGISDALASLIPHRVTIPPFSENPAAESLNAAMAAGILLSEFRSKNFDR